VGTLELVVMEKGDDSSADRAPPITEKNGNFTAYCALRLLDAIDAGITSLGVVMKPLLTISNDAAQVIALQSRPILSSLISAQVPFLGVKEHVLSRWGGDFETRVGNLR